MTMANKFGFRIPNREPITCANTRIIIPERCYEKSLRLDRNIIGKRTRCNQRLYSTSKGAGPVIKSYSMYYENSYGIHPMDDYIASMIHKQSKYRKHNPAMFNANLSQPIVSEFTVFSKSVCIK